MRRTLDIEAAQNRAHVQALHRGVWVNAILIRWGAGQKRRGQRCRVQFLDGSERTLHQRDVRLPQ